MEALLYRGAFTHRGGQVEFYYPAGVRWGCARCGRCCRDVEGHERRILLLNRDIERIGAAGAEGFHEATGSEPFTGVMLKEAGVCVFLTPQGCAIYEDRALLCDHGRHERARHGGSSSMSTRGAPESGTAPSWTRASTGGYWAMRWPRWITDFYIPRADKPL